MSDDKPKTQWAFDQQSVAHYREALRAKREVQAAPAPAPNPKPATPPKKD